MAKYRFTYMVYGRTVIEADNEEEAELKLAQLSETDLKDHLNFGTYDVTDMDVIEE